MLGEHDVAHFQALGYVVLRRAFEPGALAAEVDRSLADSARAGFTAQVGVGTTGGRYVPMMCERTPVSVALLDRLLAVAEALLGRAAVPGRAKGVTYSGSTPWHSDSQVPVASVGLLAYLEPLVAERGALRVVPGSHEPAFGAAAAAFAARFADLPADRAIAALPGVALATEPGDIIAFDEHLLHASAGGRDRRQWRVDYVADPRDAAEEAQTRAYFATQHEPGWDGGYDVDRYPSYGPQLRASGRPWLASLARLGVFAAAEAEEAYVRSLAR